MNELQRDILGCIGHTSMLALRNIVPENGARILLKLESENPSGSMKDRTALAMIEAAEADGRLARGGFVVEYTGGSLGVSLSLVCAVKGYPLRLVTSDAFAREKLDHMALMGAVLEIVKSDGGRMTEQLTRSMVETAREIANEPGSFWTDQLNNTDQIAAYHRMAEEIRAQTGGQVDGFVQSVGTAASLRGVGEALRSRDDRIRVVAVEPAESPVLSGGKSGAHKIDGIGAVFVVPLWEEGVADRIERVSQLTSQARGLALGTGSAIESAYNPDTLTMSTPKTLTTRFLVFLALAALAGVTRAAQLTGRIDLTDDGKRATGVHRAVITFTPAAGAPALEVPAEPFEVTTVRKRFEPPVITIPVGSTVAFPNQDRILHNVFSVSGENRFDLGLYRGGESEEKTFEAPGVVQVFCNVHHSMSAYIVVVETPYHTSPETDGTFTLSGLPEGRGTLAVWHDQVDTVEIEVDVPSATRLVIPLEITKKRIPQHLNKFGKPYSRKHRGKAY